MTFEKPRRRFILWLFTSSECGNMVDGATLTIIALSVSLSLPSFLRIKSPSRPSPEVPRCPAQLKSEERKKTRFSSPSRANIEGTPRVAYTITTSIADVFCQPLWCRCRTLWRRLDD